MLKLLKKLLTVDEISSDDVIELSIRKYRGQYLAVVSLVGFFEIFMFIRGLIYFDLTKVNRQMYMGCYISLFIMSLACGLQLNTSIKEDKIPKLLKRSVYIYCIFLIIWSACISALDVLGGHMPLVYMTVIMGTAALAFIRPIVFYGTTIPLSAGMLYFTSAYGQYEASTGGFVINFSVFMIITFFIIYRQYYQNIRDFVIVRKLEALSYHDQLTGIYNRLALNQQLANISNNFYFGIIDLDNFKHINDTYGHDFGDECLKQVSALLQECFGDKTFRFGGDEFVVVSDKREDEIISIGEHVNEQLQQTYTQQNISISGGFYFPKSSKESYQDYLKKADDALYKAKKKGKKQFIIYGQKKES